MEKKESVEKVVHYVGVGASAGGLEAIEELFSGMPEDSGMAFIVIQHLSPDYKSLMVEILSKRTKIPVNYTVDGMVVQPNNIYMIPPRKNLTIFHGKLILKEKDLSRSINLPIDIFFKSLAEDKAERAIAIILSGTGSDGTRGVRAVKEHGGMVMVQDESSCKFNGMPRAAISTGMADFILHSQDMSDQLMAYVGHPYVARNKPSGTLLTDENGLIQIFAELREKTKVDFTYYKPSTISRRIERRMTVNQIDQLGDYVRYLQKYPVEVITLYKELLIGVTSFFRNPEAMDVLMKEGLTELIHQSSNRELRFWVTACSTGEEAYTIAILVKEAMESLGVSRDIKIFATDLDRDAIVRAGNGIYPESIAADLNPTLLGKYFYRKDENYQIARHIREMVVFAQHNLVKDPPFTKIDLICCRNLLIYLQPVLQQKVMEWFNFSLNPSGILFLGGSETIGDMGTFFAPIHQKYKIYRCTGKHQVLRQPLDSVRNEKKNQSSGHRPFAFQESSRRFSRVENNNNMMNRYMSALENHLLPLSVIVNDKLDIIHIFGDARDFLKVPSGKAEFNISKMATKELAIPLSTGIQRVFRKKKELLYTNVKISKKEELKRINLRIIPLPEKKGFESLVTVFFEEVKQDPSGSLPAIEVYNIEKDVQQRIKDLEQELQFSNENLQATIEELETSNEELQATNEELLASNEELQSTNEELQSTNEELFTVNAEYQNKINELTEMNNDVQNLLNSSGIEILILDENNEIRKYSPRLNEIFNILDKDLGRPIDHISHHILDFDILNYVGKIQKDNKPVSLKKTTRDNTHYMIRILPYDIGPNTYSGTILTFVDITESENAKLELQHSRQASKDMIHHIPLGMYFFKKTDQGTLVLENINSKAREFLGGDFEQLRGKTMEALWPELAECGVLKNVHGVLNTCTSYLSGTQRINDSNYPDKFEIIAFSLPGDMLAVVIDTPTSLLE